MGTNRSKRRIKNHSCMGVQVFDYVKILLRDLSKGARARWHPSALVTNEMLFKYGRLCALMKRKEAGWWARSDAILNLPRTRTWLEYQLFRKKALVQEQDPTGLISWHSGWLFAGYVLRALALPLLLAANWSSQTNNVLVTSSIFFCLACDHLHPLLLAADLASSSSSSHELNSFN